MLFLAVIFFFFIAIALRYRKKKIENEDMREEFENQLMNSRLEMQEQTLHFVSKELHDNIGQIASLLKIYLGTIKYEDSEKLKIKIEDSKELVNNLVMDVRLLSTTLNTEKLLKLDLTEAAKIEALKLERTDLFKITVNVKGLILPMDSDKKLISFRILQEILNNIVKHSEAKNIIIDFNYGKSDLTLTVSDDGRGFNIEEAMSADSTTGNGLVNMQNRAQALKGTIHFQSQPGMGSTTILKIPV